MCAFLEEEGGTYNTTDDYTFTVMVCVSMVAVSAHGVVTKRTKCNILICVVSVINVTIFRLSKYFSLVSDLHRI